MKTTHCNPATLNSCTFPKSKSELAADPALEGFVFCWKNLNGKQVANKTIRTAVVLRQTYVHAIMELEPRDERIFQLDMFIKKSIDKISPLQIFNTRVNSKGCTEDYSSILKLLSKCVPPGTELLTYVREPQTLDSLSSRYDEIQNSRVFGSLPLVNLFVSSGWEFVDVQRINASQALRKFPIRFRTEREV